MNKENVEENQDLHSASVTISIGENRDAQVFIGSARDDSISVGKHFVTMKMPTKMFKCGNCQALFGFDEGILTTIVDVEGAHNLSIVFAEINEIVSNWKNVSTTVFVLLSNNINLDGFTPYRNAFIYGSCTIDASLSEITVTNTGIVTKLPVDFQVQSMIPLPDSIPEASGSMNPDSIHIPEASAPDLTLDSSMTPSPYQDTTLKISANKNFYEFTDNGTTFIKTKAPNFKQKLSNIFQVMN